MTKDHTRHNPFLALFFAVFVIFVICVLAVVLMKTAPQETIHTNTNTAANANTINVNQAKNTNAVVDAAGFLSRHKWYTSAMQMLPTEKMQNDIVSYDFGENNLILDMSVSMTGAIEEAYGRLSTTTTTVQGVTVEIVKGASAKDGATVYYAIVPYSDTRSLVVRGEEDFVDDILPGLVFAEE